MSGYILLFLQPRDGRVTQFPQWRKELIVPQTDISSHMYLDAVDSDKEPNPYRHLNIYRFTGSTPPTESEIQERLLSGYMRSHIFKFEFQIYDCITEIRQSSFPAATVVTVGMSIPADSPSREELDRWYTKEHIPGLATVPGWQACLRLQLLHSANRETSLFLAIHEWAEPNGLGGDIWKKAVFTPWTDRISKLQTAPMIRHKWKSV